MMPAVAADDRRSDAVERVRVLLVEDNALLAVALERALETHFDVEVASNVDTALAASARPWADVVVTDLDLCDPKGRDGVWLLDRIQQPGLVLSGRSLVHERYPALQKPVTPAALVAAIRAARRSG